MGYFKRNTNDAPVRKFGIQFTKERFGYVFEEHPNRFAIDLINPNDEKNGCEMEAGSWTGDLWDNDGYNNLSNVGEPTINIPIRKLKYWYDKTDDGVKPNKLNNLFIRTNRDFTQAIVIRPKTIRDKNKILWTEFKPSNSDEVEQWMSFRREHVETYNLKKGKWVQERIKK